MKKTKLPETMRLPEYLTKGLNCMNIGIDATLRI